MQQIPTICVVASRTIVVCLLAVAALLVLFTKNTIFPSVQFSAKKVYFVRGNQHNANPDTRHATALLPNSQGSQLEPARKFAERFDLLGNLHGGDSNNVPKDDLGGSSGSMQDGGFRPIQSDTTTALPFLHMPKAVTLLHTDYFPCRHVSESHIQKIAVIGMES